tara:strand:+ start:818 stop:2743 length:1926 start_codon:yes stop_codon:yes gene_type:complete
MPPESDGIRTVGCSLVKLVPCAEYLNKIQDAVAATHKATILATELLNIHLRKCMQDNPDQDLAHFFNGSWLLNAYNEVTHGKRKVTIVPELRNTRDLLMPTFQPPDRAGIQQCLLYDARNLATVAATNIWLHFQPRMLSHVRQVFGLEDKVYHALSKDEKRKRKLELLQVASDMCRLPSQDLESPHHYHDWIRSERKRLNIIKALGTFKGESFAYHVKARPHRFIYTLFIISQEREAAGKGAFALYPLRRNYVPRHVRFDQKALRDLLGLGRSDYIKEKAKQSKKQKTSVGDTAASQTMPKRRTKEEMKDENEELFQIVLDLQAAKVQRRHLFDYAFTTDGVCARVQMKAASKNSKGVTSRGLWAIDELKHQYRLQDLHTVGVDPGKRELIVGVDMDDPVSASPVRYTQSQRLRDLRSRQYTDENRRERTQGVKDAETALAGYNSRSTDLVTFCAYCSKRHETLEQCLASYSTLSYRKRRWKTNVKTQQSEERLYKRLEKLQNDSRPLVLAYGSWGLVAGRTGMACNRGNPPCIGVGLMRKLSKRFLVSPTPEAYTSKTCSRCLGECGPCFETEAFMKKNIRGLRRCTQRDCMLFLNRDKNGATNIGTNFKRLFEDKVPIRSMTDEDLAFHRAMLCLECAE